MTTHTAITDYFAGAALDDGSLLCHRTTDAVIETASATSELSSGGGVYSAVFADVVAGSYRLKLLSEGEVVATRDVTFAGTDNEIVETGVKAELDSASIAAIQSGLATSSQITALSGTTVQVASPNVQGNLVLTQGDDYDGIANPRASWTVSTDYTDGWSVTLTIRDADDAVIYTTSGEAVSSTVVAVTIEAPTGLTMKGCPGQWQGKFDVEMTKSGSKKTIALGVCYINEDQTR